MRAARTFALGLREDGLLERVAACRPSCSARSAHTGHGHGTDRAVMLGLEGETPEGVDLDRVPLRCAEIAEHATISLLGHARRRASTSASTSASRREKLPRTRTACVFTALDADGHVLRERIYYSVGGGFVVDESGAPAPIASSPTRRPCRYPFRTAAELLEHVAASTALRSRR